jgi:hypothetical protein
LAVLWVASVKPQSGRADHVVTVPLPLNRTQLLPFRMTSAKLRSAKLLPGGATVLPGAMSVPFFV